MRFGILGPTQLHLADGRAVALRGSRLRALLVLLLLDADRVVPTDRLIDGLYGDRPPAGAANALQSQVSRLRQALPAEAGSPLPVEFHRWGYRLAVDPEQVDAHRFTRLAAEGHRALIGGDRPRAAAVLRAALDLWRGQPLADVRDAPFAAARAARLTEARLDAVEDRIEAELGLGAAGPLIPELRDLVAAHPLRERLHGQLMRALHGGGRQAEALAAYQDARRVLADEIGADPSPELAALHLALLRADEPPAPAPTARPGLPGHFTSFVGRDEELRRIGKLLGEARLVTLNGPGGAGKTRLAVEAARRRSGEVCFVELAPLGDGTELPQAVLGALGLRAAGLRPALDQQPQDPTERLVAALADRPLLLVLDNCEHLVAAAARLAARLLGACPGLRILATSREPLRLTGEALCPVSGLTLPPPESTPEHARNYPAVRLFAERAADVVPDFTVTPANAEAVLRICRTLDGLPLAIELAAARVRALPVAEVAARLDDRFRLLSRGSRIAEPRHQTLRAVVEWSWDLLEPAEQALARRLSVFAGGASLAAVERVCGLPGFDVVGVLTSLADKSLVEVGGAAVQPHGTAVQPHGTAVQPHGTAVESGGTAVQVGGTAVEPGDAAHPGGTDRYRMLETVRAFCAERLAEAGETERFRLAHAAHFHELAATADPHLRGGEQLEWLRRLDADRDNLHAALRRSIDSGAVRTALGLVATLAFYWWLRGLRGEGAALAAEVLRRIDAGPPEGLAEEYALCVAYAALGGTVPPGHPGGTVPPGHPGGTVPSEDPGGTVPPGEAGGTAAPGQLGSAATVWQTMNEPPRLPFLLALSGMTTGPPGDPETTAALMAQRQPVLDGDPWSRALAATGLGMTWLLDGQAEPAERELRVALDAFRAIGERWGMIMVLSARAELASHRGDHAGAVGPMDEALRLAGELGSTVDMADVLRIRGDGRRRAGDLAGARDDLDRAARLARRSGAPEVLAAARAGLGEIARQRGDLAEARRLCETALAECPTGWFVPEGIRLGLLVTLGRIAAAEGEADAARGWYQRALRGADLPWETETLVGAVEGLVELALREDAVEHAALLLGAAGALLPATAAGRLSGDAGSGRDGDLGPDGHPGGRGGALAAVRARLGEEACRSAYERGAALSRERALAVLAAPPPVG